jgi:hypothetical protein
MEAAMSVARLPPELRAKIASLLRLQASNIDGERLSASSAITRLLKNNGAVDWHDLVDVLLAEPQAAAASPHNTSWKRSTGAVGQISWFRRLAAFTRVAADGTSFRKTMGLVAGFTRSDGSVAHGR